MCRFVENTMEDQVEEDVDMDDDIVTDFYSGDDERSDVPTDAVPMDVLLRVLCVELADIALAGAEEELLREKSRNDYNNKQKASLEKAKTVVKSLDPPSHVFRPTVSADGHIDWRNYGDIDWSKEMLKSRYFVLTGPKNVGKRCQIFRLLGHALGNGLRALCVSWRPEFYLQRMFSTKDLNGYNSNRYNTRFLVGNPGDLWGLCPTYHNYDVVIVDDFGRLRHELEYFRKHDFCLLLDAYQYIADVVCASKFLVLTQRTLSGERVSIDNVGYYLDFGQPDTRIEDIRYSYVTMHHREKETITTVDSSISSA